MRRAPDPSREASFPSRLLKNGSQGIDTEIVV